MATSFRAYKTVDDTLSN